MSLEAHHRFILDTMQRNQDIARNIINELEAENARLKAEVERLRKFNDEALAHIAKEERKSRERLDMAQADVGRLIKAGDNLITALDKRDDVFDNSDKRQAIADWNAAKDASQA